MCLESGGAMRDRTADLLRARQALSQLSYNPIKFYFLGEVLFKESGGRYRARTSDPPPCKGGALPTELIAHRFTSDEKKWRPVGESNPCYRRERAVS